MSKRQVHSYVAYPAIIPYPVITFIGFMLKWSIVILCAASIPFTLWSCYRVMEKVVSSPTSVHGKTSHAPATPTGHNPHAHSTKGQQP